MVSLKKHKMIEMFFPDMAKSLSEGKCPTCKKLINKKDFDSELSLKEFEISGICQNCQKKIFKSK